jgi:hypothetical protein
MRAACAFIVACALTLAAQAQSPFPPPKSNVFARSVLQRALEQLSETNCGANRCAKTTAEEKENPPLTLSETDFVMRRAVMSSLGASCGLDWQNRNFRPMMNYMQNTLGKNERQLALMGIVHGLMFESGNKRPQPCDAKMREEVERELTFRAPAAR